MSESRLYQLILEYHTLQSDAGIKRGFLEVQKKLGRSLDIERHQRDIVNLLIRCTSLIESFHNLEKIPLPVEYFLAPSIGAIIFGTVVGLAESSVDLLIYSSVVGCILGGILVHRAQPIQKTLPEDIISRLLLLHKELTSLCKELLSEEK